MSKAEEAAGIRLAEIAEAWEGKELFWDHHEDWWKREKIEEAMSIVAAHDAERWRVPTTEDWESEKEFDVILAVHGGEWTGPNRGTLDDLSPDEAMGLVMIANPLPLPPAPGGGEG